MNSRNLIRCCLARALVLAGGALTLSFTGLINTAWAAKPPKPPPPPATSMIYFTIPEDPNTTVEIWKMNPDGSGKTWVLDLPRVGEIGDDEGYIPSKAKHGDRRWFLLLRNAGGTYPGRPGGNVFLRRELFALSDRGEVVQLTDDPSFQPNDHVMGGAMLCWTFGPAGADGRITLVGRRWNAEGTAITEVGLFAIDINPGILAGNIGANLALSPVRLPIPLSITYDDETYGDAALVRGYDWSPDGTRVVYSDGGILFIVGPDGVSPKVLVSDAVPNAHHPVWSPVLVGGQAQILFTTGTGGWQITLERINLDGTGRITVVPPYTNDRIFRYPQSTLWSPTGDYVVFAEYDSGFGVPWKKAQCDIISVTSSGSSRRSLTGDNAGWCYPRGWTLP
jgi:hypothetical protein